MWAGDFAIPAKHTKVVTLHFCRRGSACPDGGFSIQQFRDSVIKFLLTDGVVRLPNGEVAQIEVMGQVWIRVP